MVKEVKEAWEDMLPRLRPCFASMTSLTSFSSPASRTSFSQ